MLNVAVSDGFAGSQDNFLMSLTSTGWGVGVAILFKVFVDPFISPDVEKFNREVEDVELERKKMR